MKYSKRVYRIYDEESNKYLGDVAIRPNQSLRKFLNRKYKLYFFKYKFIGYINKGEKSESKINEEK